MKGWTYLIWTCALMVSMALSSSVAAQEETADTFYLARKMNREKMSDVYQQLNLSDRQVKDLERNRKKHHDRIKALTAEVQNLKARLSRELERPQIDAKKIAELQASLNQRQAQLNDLRLQGIMGVRTILSEEQYQRFQELTR